MFKIKDMCIRRTVEDKALYVVLGLVIEDQA